MRLNLQPTRRASNRQAALRAAVEGTYEDLTLRSALRPPWRCSRSPPLQRRPRRQEEQQACMNDAFSVCGHAIPDRDRVAGCLAENFSRISVACRTVMQRYSNASNSRAAPGRQRPNDRF